MAAGTEGTAEGDRAYANAAFIRGGERYFARWTARAAAFRRSMPPGRLREGLRYGPAPREAFDLFLPGGPARGLLVVLHGGYWMATGRGDWSHLAAGGLARGWAVAIPSYTLAPEARIAAMARQAVRAVGAARALVPGPLVVAGHSAGGHLAARMACTDGPRGLSRVMPISPLADLGPLAATAMNATLGLDAAEIARESPARLRPRRGVAVHVWVGGQERPAFLWQARTLSEAWGCPWTVEAGRHHFDVIEGLEAAGSPLMAALLDGL
mgnify:FL=1